MSRCLIFSSSRANSLSNKPKGVKIKKYIRPNKSGFNTCPSTTPNLNQSMLGTSKIFGRLNAIPNNIALIIKKKLKHLEQH